MQALSDEQLYSLDLNTKGYPGKWKHAKEMVRTKTVAYASLLSDESMEQEDVFFWMMVRRCFLELGGDYSIK